jgi:hypothetical protein
VGDGDAASCQPRRCEPPRTAVGEVSGLKTTEAARATTAGCSAMPEGEAVEAPSTEVVRDSSTGREVCLRRRTTPGALALDQLPALVALSGIRTSPGGRGSQLRYRLRGRVSHCWPREQHISEGAAGRRRGFGDGRGRARIEPTLGLGPTRRQEWRRVRRQGGGGAGRSRVREGLTGRRSRGARRRESVYPDLSTKVASKRK